MAPLSRRKFLAGLFGAGLSLAAAACRAQLPSAAAESHATAAAVSPAPTMPARNSRRVSAAMYVSIYQGAVPLLILHVPSPG